jgi:Protein of unknown function (DUF2568)
LPARTTRYRRRGRQGSRDTRSSGAPPAGARRVIAVNLGVRLLVELGAYAALGYWGASVAAPLAERALLAVLTPAAAIALWSLFLAPRARLPLREPEALALELAIFAGAAAALALSGPAALGAAGGAVAAANALLIRVLGRRYPADGAGRSRKRGR